MQQENIWFGMFLCAFDWRTSRCFLIISKLWRDVKPELHCGRGTLKLFFFFFLWSTCYFWVFVPYGCGVVQCCAVFCFSAQSSMHRPGLDSHSDQMICYTVNQTVVIIYAKVYLFAFPCVIKNIILSGMHVFLFNWLWNSNGFVREGMRFALPCRRSAIRITQFFCLCQLKCRFPPIHSNFWWKCELKSSPQIFYQHW